MIYFDNAATTKPSKECLNAFVAASEKSFFNPSASYLPSVEVKKEMEKARLSMLSVLGGSGKLIFTSSGTEADNQAVFSTVKPHGSKILISAAEHPAVYNPVMELKQKGFETELIKVKPTGEADEEDFISKLDDKVSFVSIMHVSNETGAINDIEKLVALTRKYAPKAVFHSDGVQAAGKIKIDLDKLGVDLYSMSAHKLHAPRGTGALYVKRGVSLHPFIFGGGQEEGLRSSTENFAGIIAFSEALAAADKTLLVSQEKCRAVKNFLAESLLKIGGEDIEVLSPFENPYILTFSMRRIRGEVMQHALEKYGIYVGTGSACSSKKGVKRIPEALGLSGSFRDGIMRLSFAAENNLDEAKEFIKCFSEEYSILSKYYRG